MEIVIWKLKRTKWTRKPFRMNASCKIKRDMDKTGDTGSEVLRR